MLAMIALVRHCRSDDAAAFDAPDVVNEDTTGNTDDQDDTGDGNDDASAPLNVDPTPPEDNQEADDTASHNNVDEFKDHGEKLNDEVDGADEEFEAFGKDLESEANESDVSHAA